MRTIRLTIAAISFAVPLTACSDSEPSADEKACDLWFDIAEADNPTDAQATSALQQIVATGPSSDIAGTANALIARLRDNVDISVSFQRMNDLCADV